ncbi:MAG: trigger factor [candidate division WOR-3 bacterium]|nr:trigger factor [candidate division WOR-3 bacterium]
MSNHKAYRWLYGGEVIALQILKGMSEIASTLESPSDSERTLKISVSSSLVAKKEKELLSRYSKEVSIDGFRKGKVPISIIKKRFGDALKEEAVEGVCRDAYIEAIRGKGIIPLTRAQIGNIKQAEDTLSFTASFEVIPDVDIDYKDITVELPIPSITDKDIDRVIEEMRISYATYIPVVRVSAPGDYLVINYNYLKEEKGLLRPDTVTNFGFILGSNVVPDEFNKKLVGRRPGENVEVNIRYPLDYKESSIAGREITYNIMVNEVKEVKLPPVDDEFAKICGFQNIEELREHARKTLSERVDAQIKEILPGVVLNKLVEQCQFAPPKVFVDIAYEDWQDDVKNGRVNSMDEKEMGERAVWDAKAKVILSMIADKENLTVTDEELKEILIKSLSPAEVKTVFKDTDRRDYIRAYLRRGKALDLVVKNAKVEYAEKVDRHKTDDQRPESPKLILSH